MVPILRAGMGMLDGFSLPYHSAVGVLGMERDEQTHQPHRVLREDAEGIADRTVFLIDYVGHRHAARFRLFIICERSRGVCDIRFLVRRWLPRRFAPFCGRPRCSHLDVRAG